MSTTRTPERQFTRTIDELKERLSRLDEHIAIAEKRAHANPGGRDAPLWVPKNDEN